MTRPQTQQKLIEAAMELFAFQGYANTGLAQISKKAGAQPGSLYHFYPTKEDLLAATLEERLTLLWPEVLQPIWFLSGMPEGVDIRSSLGKLENGRLRAPQGSNVRFDITVERGAAN